MDPGLTTWRSPQALSFTDIANESMMFHRRAFPELEDSKEPVFGEFLLYMYILIVITCARAQYITQKKTNNTIYNI